jgi:hypothetical protein
MTQSLERPTANDKGKPRLSEDIDERPYGRGSGQLTEGG